ncbi:MAG: hypothetical protein H6581_21060 [Bacteroidia bacterium]|nr:hypothetical protein [Bacteroidia bacterium]
MSDKYLTTDILRQSLVENWAIYEKSDRKANWIILPDSIQQSAVSGGTSTQSGSFLVWKGENGLVSSLFMGLQPGKTGHSGLVFNFIDEDNFSLFVINQGRSGSKNHSIQILYVSGGRDSELFKESQVGNANLDSTLSIENKEQGLEFYYNGKLQFRAEGIHFQSKFGLYTRGNKDSLFRELKSMEADVNSVPKPAEMPLSNEGVSIENPGTDKNGNPKVPTNSAKLNKLMDFLEIQPPDSKTTIEFPKIFTAPLDSLYSQLYRHSALTKSGGSSGFSEIKLIDMRPLSWYRQLKNIDEELEFVANDKQVARKCLTDLQVKATSKSDLSTDDYSLLQQEILIAKANYYDQRMRLDSLTDAKNLILRDVSTNGYTYNEATNSEQIKALGYNFHLSVPRQYASEWVPMQVEPNFDYADEAKFDALIARMEDEIFKYGTLSNQMKQIYLDSLAKLRGDLEAERIEKEASLFPLTSQRDALEQRENELRAKAGWWWDDRATLIDGQTRLIPQGPWPGSKIGELVNNFISFVNDRNSPPHNPDTAPYPFNWRYPFNSSPSLRRLKMFEYGVHFNGRYPDGNGNDTFFIVDFFDPPSGVGFNYVLHYSSSAIRGYFDRYGIGNDQPTNYNMDPRIPFFGEAIRLVDIIYARTMASVGEVNRQLTDVEYALKVAREANDDFLSNKYSIERKAFVDFWNRADNPLLAKVNQVTVFPDKDPLSEFLVDSESLLTGKNLTRNTQVFSLTPGGYVSQFGEYLSDFMYRGTPESMNDIVAILPVFSGSGGISNEVAKAVKNPQISNAPPEMPTIKFVETYVMTIGWNGYALGELSHSFNLFPGEVKDLVIEKQTTISRKLTQSQSGSQEVGSKQSSSFEENLANEFSFGAKQSSEQENKSKSQLDSSSKSSASTTNTTTRTFEYDINADTKFDIGIFKTGMDGGYKRGGTDTSTWTQSGENALGLSLSEEGRQLSNQSSDSLIKNSRNSIKKVASETSSNNKLEFSTVSNMEFSETSSNKETIHIENPNMGRSVNYHFFQIQNLYGIKMHLADVKIVVDTGVEMVAGTGISDMRVFELEEIGKIFPNSDQSPRWAILSAIVARKAMMHYGNFLPGLLSGNGALGVLQGTNLSRETFETILQPKVSEIDKLKIALDELKKIPFLFQDTMLLQEDEVAVNAGAYYMESEVGRQPATEKYLEDRRNIETEKNRQEVELTKAKIAAKAFWPPAAPIVTGNSAISQTTEAQSETNNV